MAGEDQRDAREADVAGGDRRTSKRAEGSADPRHEPVDGFLRSKGIRFLEAAKVAWPPTSVGQAARAPAHPLARGGRDRVVAGGRGLESRASEKGGSETGPSPVDRARNGSKHHPSGRRDRDPARPDGHGRQPQRRNPACPADRASATGAQPAGSPSPPTRACARRPRLRLRRAPRSTARPWDRA
jgi:hypothetical protein